MIIKRETYLNKVWDYIGNPIIKVITGMRRSGKSYFLRQIIQKLEEDNAGNYKIIYIDKESSKFDFITGKTELDNYLNSELKDSKQNYLLIDEVQEITSWEKSLSSIIKNKQAEVFITGSNAHLLSSELATYISGRYIEFPIYPLSFAEFLEFRKANNDQIDNTENEFNNYIKFGSLPGIHNSKLNEEISYPLIKAILNTVVLKDVVAKFEIRNYSNFEKILRFIFDNIGSTFSAKSISDYLKSQKITISVETVQNYLSFLESAYLIYRAKRFDIQGKKYLEIYEKYYLSDLSFRHVLNGYKPDDINDFLENIVFLELKRRGYEISIGKISDLEIDFIAKNPKQTIFIQVSYLLASKEVEERELRALLKIKSSHPKYILSMDKLSGEDENGIRRLNIIDFLLEQKL